MRFDAAEARTHFDRVLKTRADASSQHAEARELPASLDAAS